MSKMWWPFCDGCGARHPAWQPDGFRDPMPYNLLGMEYPIS